MPALPYRELKSSIVAIAVGFAVCCWIMSDDLAFLIDLALFPIGLVLVVVSIIFWVRSQMMCLISERRPPLRSPVFWLGIALCVVGPIMAIANAYAHFYD